MKKVVVITSLLFSISMADSVLLVNKGWQLIGSSEPINNMIEFKKENVEQVWSFDASTQTWLGYSPDEKIQQKMSAKGIKRLNNLKNWHGFWLKSSKDWTMTLKDKKLTSEPITQKNADVIELKKGWNLISLPVDTVVSADIFKGLTTWKYNDKQWKLSDATQTEEDFPEIEQIGKSDGLWVKAENDQNLSVMQEASKLHNFKTVAEIESYVKQMAKLSNSFVDQITYDNGMLGEDALANSDTSNMSDTNLQEAGVDEADILKHNDKNIFYVGKSTNGSRDHINIGSFEALASGEKTALNTIMLEGKEIDSFYLVDDKLVVLSSFSHKEASASDSKASVMQQGSVEFFDVSDIDNVKKIAQYKIDGSLTNSRVIGDNLYLISSFYPEYETSYPKEYVEPSEKCLAYLEDKDNKEVHTNISECYNIVTDENGKYFRYDYDHPSIKITDLLPEIEGTNLASKALITPSRFYASANQKQLPNMTSISKFSIDSASYLKSTSYLGDNSVSYASSEALYLVSNAFPYYYDFNNYKERTTIYKFQLDEALSYKAVGAVSGTALNQFSLSEQNDVLRIVTTEGFSWGSTGTHNRLYTLKEKSGLLTVEGTLSGLGKEGESIKSVRFMGNRAYVVTFKTSDPLYTIDLSNPKAPQKMGALEIAGYSAYLHPIGEDKLLGVGRDTDEEGTRLGVKIELFDISDFENPSSLDSIVLPNGTSSELEFNHKALAYRTSDQLFAFPYQQYLNGVVSSFTQNNLGIYQVTNGHLKSYEPLIGESETWGEHRGLIFDQNNKTYISFFADDEVVTKALKEKEIK